MKKSPQEQFEELARKNADLSKTNLDNVKTPAFLNVMLGEKDNVIQEVSEPQLLPLKEINVSQKNPGRKNGVKMSSVRKILNNMKEVGWKDNGEVCVVVKMENPEPGSPWKYSIYFTLHRYTASKNIQKEYGIANPVLPCVVVTLKEGLSEDEWYRAIVDMADYENEQTSKNNIHEEYDQDSKDENVIDYLSTFPKLKNPKQKLSHLKKVWKPKQLARGMDPRTASAVIKRLKGKIGIVSPMVRFGNEELRTDWIDNDFESFDYCGEDIISLDLDYDGLQCPFGDDREFIVMFWHQPHFNRNFGNLMERATNLIENGIFNVKILVVLDAHKAQGLADIDKVRKERVVQIERHMKHVSQEVRDLVHFVGFVPQVRNTEDLTTLISYKQLKEQLGGK